MYLTFVYLTSRAPALGRLRIFQNSIQNKVAGGKSTFFEILIKIKSLQQVTRIKSVHFDPSQTKPPPCMLWALWLSLATSWPWNACATRLGPRRGGLKGPQRQEEWLLGRGAGAAAGSQGPRPLARPPSHVVVSLVVEPRTQRRSRF